MAIQKPQIPLSIGVADPQQIYPLTSADQVIMADGSRLNAAMEGLKPPAYTAADYGKFLTCSEAGYQWETVAVTGTAELTNVEGVSF